MVRSGQERRRHDLSCQELRRMVGCEDRFLVWQHVRGRGHHRLLGRLIAPKRCYQDQATQKQH